MIPLTQDLKDQVNQYLWDSRHVLGFYNLTDKPFNLSIAAQAIDSYESDDDINQGRFVMAIGCRIGDYLVDKYAKIEWTIGNLSDEHQNVALINTEKNFLIFPTCIVASLLSAGSSIGDLEEKIGVLLDPPAASES